MYLWTLAFSSSEIWFPFTTWSVLLPGNFGSAERLNTDLHFCSIPELPRILSFWGPFFELALPSWWIMRAAHWYLFKTIEILVRNLLTSFVALRLPSNTSPKASMTTKSYRFRGSSTSSTGTISVLSSTTFRFTLWALFNFIPANCLLSLYLISYLSSSVVIIRALLYFGSICMSRNLRFPRMIAVQSWM